MKETQHTARPIRTSVLIISLISAFVTPFMGSAVNVALPTIGTEFRADAISLSWVATSYLLTTAIFLVPFGRLADITGRKRIYLTGTVLWGASCLISGLSESLWMLITARIVQGIGSAMVFGTGMAIITSVFPPGERGKIMGINVTSTYLGLSLGPVIGGLITQYINWRWIFFMTAPLSIIIVCLILILIKTEWADAKEEKFDLKGSLIYGISIAQLIYGFSLLPQIAGTILISSGLLGITGFIILELYNKMPLLNIRLFVNNRIFGFSNLAALINYCATFATGFLLSFYLQKIKGFSAEHSGMILVAQPIVMAVFSPFMGWLSDKIYPQIVATIGMAITTIGLSLFIFVTSSTPVGFIIITLATLGLGFAFFSSPNTNAVMSSVDKKVYGIASGTVATMRILGQMLSMGIAMLLFSIFIGKVEIKPGNYPQFLQAFHIAFIIFSVMCFFGIFMSLARGKSPKPLYTE
ncbi:MAG: MFS transporter [Bacteroidia bacterium]|nr:MFS transporter [Bacteroidia bacterium]